VLLLISYKGLQDRNGFTPLFKHKHFKAAASRRFFVVAEGKENALKALEILVSSNGAVRNNLRRDAETRLGMLALASLREPVPEVL
jgi:hypothetical protein